MVTDRQRIEWEDESNCVTDLMKVHTRPYVVILAGGEPGERPPDVATGTFLDPDGVKLLTCEHVARLKPSATYVDDQGSTQIQPGIWCVDPVTTKDVAFAPIDAMNWSQISGRACPLPISRFAIRHAPAALELLFFRGIAGENATVTGWGANGILTGYGSQEKPGTGDAQLFEILWSAGKATVTTGTDREVRDRFQQGDSRGFSGSLVWNTRFVELGRDLSTWSPDDAVVTGIARRYDEKTGTILAWRIEHLSDWLNLSIADGALINNLDVVAEVRRRGHAGSGFGRF
jgi:hypothetical protein